MVLLTILTGTGISYAQLICSDLPPKRLNGYISIGNELATATLVLGVAYTSGIDILRTTGSWHIGGNALVNQVVLDLLGKPKERLVHVGVGLGRRLDIAHAKLIGKFLSLLGSNDL